MRYGFAIQPARLVSYGERFRSSLEEIDHQTPSATRQHGKWASAVDALDTRPTKAHDFREDCLVSHIYSCHHRVTGWFWLGFLRRA
jgi:hypothetical protein